MKPNCTLFSFLLLSSLTPLNAEVSLPKVLGDHMVLQRDQPIPIWGKAAPNEPVTVTFQQQKKRTHADTQGAWKVTLDPISASAKPTELTVEGTNKVVLQDILVGEVWLCSGQSNMELPTGTTYKNLKAAALADTELAEELKGPGLPEVRLFRVEKQIQPPEVVSTGWQTATADAVNPYSAVGYTFARKLQRELKVPVGMIQAAWGGTRIEVWTPPVAYQTHPAFQKESASQPLVIDGVAPGKQYAAMVKPLAPFAIRGVLWYQGESNLADVNDTLRYIDKFEAMVRSWRAEWNSPNLPFLTVQLAPYTYSNRPKDKLAHTPTDLPEFWEAQQLALAIPSIGIVPTTDLVENVRDIHPIRKRPVGERLVHLALSKLYNRPNLTTSGPIFENMKITGNRVSLTFKQTGNGLKSSDGKPLSNFEISGADGIFKPAEARIENATTVIVSSPEIPTPTTVRFAWQETAQPNLSNSETWPAYPFRTNPATWTSSIK